LPYLTEAIDSVLAQTLRPNEIIVTDDCSTDGSQAVIEGYASRYSDLIRPIFHSKNLGVSRNRNFALKEAQGTFVTTLDGDDRYLPQKLERELDIICQRSDVHMVYSNMRLIDSQGKRIREWITNPTKAPTGDIFQETFMRSFPYRTFFRFELINYQLLREVGFYDPSLSVWEDWELAIRLTKILKVDYCHAVLVEVRRHGKGLSATQLSSHLDALQYIYSKNRSLLSDLPTETQRTLKHSFLNRLARVARRAAREALSKGDKAEAIRHWIQAVRYRPIQRKDIDLISQIVLSEGIYNNAKKHYADFLSHFV
jgi:glycosyltransferase involved in cell wall biosynthesis